MTLGMAECKKETPDKTGNVPYDACLCNEVKQLSNLSFPSGQAYLFKDSIPKQKEQQLYEIAYQGHIIRWIVFNTETSDANLYIAEGAIMNICGICNFPDFAKKWKIPLYGLNVYFEGITYEPCTVDGGFNVSYFDYILTTLIIK